MSKKKKIIVIGSGFGGLAVASRLLSQGHEVVLFEKRDKPGGRAYTYHINGFTFDGGPTVITAPFLFDELFEAAGKRRDEAVTFVPCDPFYRIFDAHGNRFDYNGDHAFIMEEIRKRNPSDADGYERFIRSTKAIFEKGFIELADQPFLKFTDMLKVAPDLLKLQSYKSVYRYVSRSEERRVGKECRSTRWRSHRK